ncbi:MAG: ATP-binding protein [Nocardioidaceae bacterium]
MGRVELHLDQDPAHVRVVRLVSAAVGRMAGLGDETLHEVRLGVSEACGLAIDALAASGIDTPMSLEFEDDAGLRVTVRTAAALPDPAIVTSVEPGTAGGRPTADPVVLDRLALIEGLIDDVVIKSGPDGSAITMRWQAGLG